MLCSGGCIYRCWFLLDVCLQARQQGEGKGMRQGGGGEPKDAAGSRCCDAGRRTRLWGFLIYIQVSYSSKSDWEKQM